MRIRISLLAALFLIGGCASGPAVKVTTTDHPVGPGREPVKVEVFQGSDDIFAHVSVSGDLARPARLQAKWLCGGVKRAMSRIERVASTPAAYSFVVPASQLNPGECRVDVFLDDALAASQVFGIRTK